MSFVAPDTLELFFAHATTLEDESVERYQELADTMRVHNNDELANLFEKLAGYGEHHAAEIRQESEGLTLPILKPWEFRWVDAESPETAGFGDAHYLMTPYHALTFARENEQRGQQYYASVAEKSPHSEVARLAAEFALEEAEHVSLLDQWLSKVPPPGDDWDTELDPANQPE